MTIRHPAMSRDHLVHTARRKADRAIAQAGRALARKWAARDITMTDLAEFAAAVARADMQEGQ